MAKIYEDMAAKFGAEGLNLQAVRATRYALRSKGSLLRLDNALRT